MRVAIVAPLVTAIREPQLGGSQALLADIATGLVCRGYDVTVFAASGSSIDGVRVVDTGVDPSALSTTLYRAEGNGGSGAADDAFARSYELIGREVWDVIHNHAFDAPAITLAPATAPVVHTLHLPPDERIVAAIRSRGAASIATVSSWMRAAWSEHIRVDVVLRNGVPVDEIPFSSIGGERVMCAGRLSPEKGVAEAIDAARAAGLPITVVGDPYDEEYASRIESHATGDVEFLRALPRRDLWGLMAGSRAVLCLVRWDEPFGLVAAEALATGTPVIATRRGALVEVVADGTTGSIVGGTEEAATALRSIGAVDRAACRAHAERELSLERTLDAHEELYRTLCITNAASR